MAGVQLRIDVDDREVRDALKRLRKNAAATQAAFEDIGSMIVSSTQQRIESEKASPDGVPWPSLAASTQRKRARAGRAPGDMLRFDGDLYRSITYLASDEDVVVGTNRRYAALQQLGGTPDMKNPGARAVPARPFLGVSEDDQEEILRIITDHLMEGV